MNIVKIPAAYFIYVPIFENELGRWINLAQVITIDETDSTIAIHFVDKSKMVLSGDRAKYFLKELEKLNQK